MRRANGRAAPDPEIRVVALGDSYTIGEAVSPGERWTTQLVALLRSRGLPVGEPRLVARTGWSTEELLAGIEAAALEPPYDLVMLLIGVNDQYRGRSAEEYGPKFERCLETAIGLGGGDAARVAVLSIPDYGVTPFAADRDPDAIAASLDRFNDVNRRLAAAAGARWVDVTRVSRRAAGDPLLLAPDGLHPSGLMYAEWARMLLPVAREALGR